MILQPIMDETLPKKSADGKSWIIGYDDDSWEPILLDDISSLDPLTRESLSLQHPASNLAIFMDKQPPPPSSTVTCATDQSSDSSTPCVVYMQQPVPSSLSVQESNPSLASPAPVAPPVLALPWVETQWEASVIEEYKPGLVGLPNLGNTCFINAGLQCLLQNNQLIDQLSFLSSSSSPLSPLANTFIALMKRIWMDSPASSSSDVPPLNKMMSEFKQELGARFHQFQDFRQHDCQEFLALLLAALDEDLKSLGVDTGVTASQSASPSSISSSSSCSSSNCDSHATNPDRSQPLPDGVSSFQPVPTLLIKESKTLNTNKGNEIQLNNINGLSLHSVKYPPPELKLKRRDDDQTLLVDNLRQVHQDTLLMGDNDSSSHSLEIDVTDHAVGGDLLIEEGGGPKKRLKKISESQVSQRTCKKKEVNLLNRTKEEYEEGEEAWTEYLNRNKGSVMVDIFQGQFRSKIQCVNCCYRATNFEPFMYLPLSLPPSVLEYTLELYLTLPRQSQDISPISLKLTIHQRDGTHKILQNIIDNVRSDLKQYPVLVLASVRNHSSINKIFSGNDSVYEYFKNTNDSLYLFALDQSSCSLIMERADTSDRIQQTNNHLPPNITTTNRSISCTICLEEKSMNELLRHEIIGKKGQCECSLCDTCLQSMVKHNCFGDSSKTFICPTCMSPILRSQFLPIQIQPEQRDISTQTLFGPQLPPSIQTTSHSGTLYPILFRFVKQSSSDGWFQYRLLPRPALILVPLPSSSELQLGDNSNVGIDCSLLYELVDAQVPFPYPYSLHLVDNGGHQCSRCAWSVNCGGCEITRFGTVNLTAQDSIAVQFEEAFEEPSSLTISSESVHEEKDELRKKTMVTIQDCLSNFCREEELDVCEINESKAGSGGWFCPVCASEQKALKSLSIWRCPQTLVVYLKRFLFHDMEPMKLEEVVQFAVGDNTSDDLLDLSPYIKDPSSKMNDSKSNENRYELRAVICHQGSINSGHYTCFARHRVNNQWHYYNDENVNEEEPSCTDDRAYILFYQRVTHTPPSSLTTNRNV